MVETMRSEEPKVEPKEEPKVEQEVKQEPDLVTRVSQVMQPEEKKEEPKFNINELDAEIEKVQDPNAKEQLVRLKKSLISGENKKYQEIAALRKEYEAKLADSTSWTPERIKAEVNKPDFVQAAQVVLGGNETGTQEDTSLSEADQKELKSLKEKINALQNSNWQAQKSHQDEVLKAKYANYAPDMIDTVTSDLMTGKRVATREDIHKVIDYENAVRRAYELGLTDRKAENTEKIAGMTYGGGGNIPQPTTLERQKGETTEQFIRRSYQKHSGKK